MSQEADWSSGGNDKELENEQMICNQGILENDWQPTEVFTTSEWDFAKAVATVSCLWEPSCLITLDETAQETSLIGSDTSFLHHWKVDGRTVEETEDLCEKYLVDEANPTQKLIDVEQSHLYKCSNKHDTNIQCIRNYLEVSNDGCQEPTITEDLCYYLRDNDASWSGHWNNYIASLTQSNYIQDKQRKWETNSLKQLDNNSPISSSTACYMEEPLKQCFNSRQDSFSESYKGISKDQFVSKSERIESLISSCTEFESIRIELNSFLKRKGLSRREFAKIANIGKNTVGKYLSGRCKRTSKEIVYKIQSAYERLLEKEEPIQLTKKKRYDVIANGHHQMVRNGQVKDNRALVMKDSSPLTEWDLCNSATFVDEQYERLKSQLDYLDGCKSDGISEPNSHSSPCLSLSSHPREPEEHSMSTLKETNARCMAFNTFDNQNMWQSSSFQVDNEKSSVACDILEDGISLETVMLSYMTSSMENGVFQATSVDNKKLESLTRPIEKLVQVENESYDLDNVEKQENDYFYSNSPESQISQHYIPLELEIRPTNDMKHETAGFCTLYPWRLRDKTQTVDIAVEEICNFYQLSEDWKKAVEDAIKRRLKACSEIGIQ